MAGDQRIRECMGQARAARRGIFVELETGMIPAMSDQKSVTGARLQNDVVRPDSRQDERNGGEIDGRRELLPFDLLFAAHRLGGQTVEQVAGRADIGERTQRIGTELAMVGTRRSDEPTSELQSPM